MFKKANKWLRDTIRPYKHENQKVRDQRQLIDGIVNFVVGLIKLIFQLINLMFIVPIKALIVDWRNFTTKYKEIGEGDISKIVPTFKRFITGLVQVLTSPIIPFRIILRLILTPAEGVSVFANSGLKSIVNDYLDKNQAPRSGETMGVSAMVMDDSIPQAISAKAQKYTEHKQKDSDELNKMLKNPLLPFYVRMTEVQDKIKSYEAEEHETKVLMRKI